MFQECAAQALDDRTDRLSVQRQWVDDPADVLDRKIVDHLDVARSRVHRDMRRLRAIGPGVFLVEERSLDLQRSVRQICELQVFAGITYLLAIDRYIGGGAIETRGSCLA